MGDGGRRLVPPSPNPVVRDRLVGPAADAKQSRSRGRPPTAPADRDRAIREPWEVGAWPTVRAGQKVRLSMPTAHGHSAPGVRRAMPALPGDDDAVGSHRAPPRLRFQALVAD